MNFESVTTDCDYLAGSGFVLSAEQKAALQTSLIITKTHYKFTKVQLWGKICGIKDDYFIVQGCGKDELKNRTSLYSFDCNEWNLLQPPTPADIKKACKLRGRFTGDPSHEYEHMDVKRVQNGGEFTEEETLIQMKEEERLAAVIATIDEEARVVPRGAYIRTPNNKTITNRSFDGLSTEECGKLSSYMHFRNDVDGRTSKCISKDANFNPAIDFLDVIENDLPRGCWSLQLARGNALVNIRSLNWLGMSFYHVPGTNKFGSLYVGIGERNHDVPFML